ncbi:TatD family deoxyribonuclease [Pelomyxa schiedti]|nr:TatD family deoxyribonuclease [Pelomyxa schiedti]
MIVPSSMLVDSHCHVNRLGVGGSRAVADALAAGVARVGGVAQSEADWEPLLALRSQFPTNLDVGVGYHPSPEEEPMFFERCSVSDAASRLREFIQTHNGPNSHPGARPISMVGEIGLDWKFGRTPAQRQKQTALLREQIQVAMEFSLPINLHSRRSERDVLAVATEFAPRVPCLLHWFTKTSKLSLAAARAGVYISIGPDVTYDEKIQSVVRGISGGGEAVLRHILLETDGPVVHQGQEAQPAWIPRVCSSVAAIFGISVDDLSLAVNKNYISFLGY